MLLNLKTSRLQIEDKNLQALSLPEAIIENWRLLYNFPVFHAYAY